MNKVANNNPDNLYTDIAAFSDGTLFYSIKNNIVQHYGNFQKLHDFSEIHLKSIFRSTNNIITYKDKFNFSLKQVTLYGYKFKIIKKSSLVYLNFRNQIFPINEKEAKATKIYKPNYEGFKRTVVIKPNLPNINISNKNRDDMELQVIAENHTFELKKVV